MTMHQEASRTDTLIVSIVIPAYNEADNLEATVQPLAEAFAREAIPFEIIVVNDNSTDDTPSIVSRLQQTAPNIKLVNRTPPGGFGRAIRSGLEAVTGDAVIIYMADQSDHPSDALAYYHKLCEGYDCVYGSRFRRDSKVENYPRFKLVVNRIVNRMIQLMFFCRFNDLTNAFKAYRTEVIRDCGPFQSSHFNITIEMSLAALVRRYAICEIPIKWSGRTWGSSNLHIGEMGRRYLAVLLKAFAERMLLADDLVAERLSHRRQYVQEVQELRHRLEVLESRLDGLPLPPATDQETAHAPPKPSEE